MNSTKAFSSKEEMLDRLTLNFVKPGNDDLKINDVTHLFISIFIDKITSKSNSCIYYGIKNGLHRDLNNELRTLGCE